MSRGEVRGWDKAYAELMKPDKDEGTRVIRKKRPQAKGKG